jgi:ATP-binding cassette, subfamily C (CFTR/MRP), member 1
MSTDVGRIDFAAGWFHMGWVTIIQILVCLVILLINIGYSALAGFGLLIIATPLVGRVVRILHQKRRKSTKFTDARVRLIQEILSSMRAIKLYTWEKSFLAKVSNVRASELKIVRYLLLLKTATNAVSMSIPVYASILAFVTYSLTGNALHAANIFSSLTLFNMMRFPLMFMPRVISACIDAWVALARIQSLLLADELEKPVVNYDSEFAVLMSNAKFVWEVDDNAEETEKSEKQKRWQRKTKNPKPDRLETGSYSSDNGKAKEGRNTEHVESVRVNTGWVERLEKTSSSSSSNDTTTIGRRSPRGTDVIPVSIERTDSNGFRTGGLSFYVKKGEFIVVVGEIGSGKSSLLAALVGEMRRTNGMVKLGGSVGFCPQTAWIQNATVKNNILFGKKFDQAKYDRVVTGCALEPDLEILPNGDETEIGERGVTLSGGQKARVNIARAAYNDADIYLLDDPLSAVDAHVGRHLLEECICGLMAGKTRILVTHQLHVLPHADRIFCMRDGRIVEQGTYEELLSRRGNFSRLIELFGNKDEGKKEDEPSEAPAPKKKEKGGWRRGRGLMEAEERKTGAVSRAVYLEYARAGGGIWIIPAILLSVILSNGVNIFTSLWLSSWTSNKYNLPQKTYVAVYTGLGFSQAIFIFLFGFILTISGNRATEKFHERVWLLKISLI